MQRDETRAPMSGLDAGLLIGTTESALSHRCVRAPGAPSNYDRRHAVMRAQLWLPAARARDEMRGGAGDPRAKPVRPERVGAGSVLDAVVDEHRSAWPSAGSQVLQVLQAVDIPKVLKRRLAGSRKLGIPAHTRNRRAPGFHSGFRQRRIGPFSQELHVVLHIFQVQELSAQRECANRSTRVCIRLITSKGHDAVMWNQRNPSVRTRELGRPRSSEAQKAASES
jgi:hypothetical protein